MHPALPAALPGFDEDEEEEEEEEGGDGFADKEEHDIISRLECLGKGCLYEDTSFSANRGSLYRSSIGAVPDYDANAHIIKWLRPHEFAQDPDYFKGSQGAGGIKKGNLDDAWLLGAMALVAAHSEGLVENLFCSDPSDFKHFGVYTCSFYKNGEWQEVVADTRIPCIEKPPRPVYGTTLDSNEIWVMLLEKAYAKLHGSYEALSGGNVGDALVDLTGGCCERINLGSEAVTRAIENGSLWEKINRYISWNYILACEVSTPDRRSGVADEDGILNKSAYGIVGAVEHAGTCLVRVRNPWQTGDWQGDWSESSPQWEDFPDMYTIVSSDKVSPPWRQDIPDGTFWMSFSDFASTFTSLYVCRLFQEDGFRQYCIHGEWSGKTAGGSPSDPSSARRPSFSKAQREGQNLLRENLRRTSSVTFQDDGDPYWFNNPQYRLTVDRPTDILVSLLHQDRRSVSHVIDYFPTAFEVMRVKRDSGGHARVWEHKRANEVSSSSSSLANMSVSSKKGLREVVKGGIQLDPKYAYNLVPHASVVGVGREGKFTLRIFSKTDVVVEPVNTTHTVYLSGAWERNPSGDSAGGPLHTLSESKKVKANPKWCQNPQYWVRIPEQAAAGNGGTTIDLKLVLRRSMDLAASSAVSASSSGDAAGVGGAAGGASSSSSLSRSRRRSSLTHNALMGIVACKAIPPETAAKSPAELRRLHRNGTASSSQPRTNALGEPLPVKESSLRQPARPWKSQEHQQVKGGFELGENPASPNSCPVNAQQVAVDRRIHISDDEWCHLSACNSPDSATLPLLGIKRESVPHGIIIVPSLSEKGVKGKFTLEIHSDHVLEVCELSDSVSKTVAAGWTEGNAGGSHLHPEWKQNPVFRLKFRKAPLGKIPVRVTLSRPERDWKAARAKDSVGSMIGFYIIRGSHIVRSRGAITHEGAAWDESPFVPAYSVSTPPNFELECLKPDEEFIIMPTTFEPGNFGPFHLSVVTGAEFSLSRSARNHTSSASSSSRNSRSRSPNKKKGSSHSSVGSTSARGKQESMGGNEGGVSVGDLEAAAAAATSSYSSLMDDEGAPLEQSVAG